MPVFINCAAPPLPPLHRVKALGEGLGQFLEKQSCRVLIRAAQTSFADAVRDGLGASTLKPRVAKKTAYL